MALHIKYRPTDFDQLIGRPELIAAVKAAVSKPDPPHSFLFHGPTGTGKTTLARICAKSLGCEGDGKIEINASDFRGIDTVREIIQLSGLPSLMGSRRRAWIIDEAHKLTNEAQNAFLKILEEPPDHVFFFICTTEPDRLLPTVRSRCATFALPRLTPQEMMLLLRRVVRAEGQSLSKSLYEQIIAESQGLPRTALQILERILDLPESERSDVSASFLLEESTSLELCQALIKRSSWKHVSSILRKMEGKDTENIRRHIMNYCSTVLLNSEDDRVAGIMEVFSEPFHGDKARLVLACYQCVKGM
jgi:DNA polymerase-3 subunit gamma/tau